MLRVTDLERARRLFADVLGWSYSPGNVGVHVEGSEPMTGMSEGTPAVSLCFRVDDISLAVERVRAAWWSRRRGGLAALRSRIPRADDQGVDFYLHQLS